MTGRSRTRIPVAWWTALAAVPTMPISPMPWRQRTVAAWFGPKGFASVVYGLLAVQAGIPDAHHVFDLVAVTIALSIVLHSTTDVPIAKAPRVEPPDNLPGTPDEDDPSTPAPARDETRGHNR